MQTLFLRLVGRELPSEIRSNPRGYLYRFAVNIALDVLRARQRRAVHGESAGMLERVAVVRASLAEEEVFAKLREALAELNPKAAQIVVLRHLHGLC